MNKKHVSTARRFVTGLFAGVVAMSLMMPIQLAFAEGAPDGSVVTEEVAGVVAASEVVDATAGEAAAVEVAAVDEPAAAAEGATDVVVADEDVKLVVAAETVGAGEGDAGGGDAITGSFFVNGESYSGTEDWNGVGESGTWSYIADGQAMTLVDYVGGTIIAFMQDLNIRLVGDNTITSSDSLFEAGIVGIDGTVTITGDGSVYGKDKPSLTLKAGEGFGIAEIAAVPFFAQRTSDVVIKDANIYVDAERGLIGSLGNTTIENSGIYRGTNNEDLFIGPGEVGIIPEGIVSTVLLKGSEIEATEVISIGTMTIDNTNLTVTPGATAKEEMAEDPEYVWIKDAVFAVDGITLIGEANGQVLPWPAENPFRYYLYTGSDDKVELKASETPAYYGPAAEEKVASAKKAMPKTGDSTMPLVIGVGSALVMSAAAAAFALRKRNEER